jgi:hypothetical protein
MFPQYLGGINMGKTVVKYKTPDLPVNLLDNLQVEEVKLYIRMRPLAAELWMEDEDFQKMLKAVNDSDTVSGNIKLDHIVATLKVQALARVKGDTIVADTQLAEAKRSFYTTRRHLGVHVKQLREKGGLAIADNSESETQEEVAEIVDDNPPAAE